MSNDDFNSLSYPAVRYALGRREFTVQTVCRALTNNAKHIRSDIREAICEEIRWHVDRNKAGGDMEVNHWNRLIEVFENEPRRS